MQMYLKKFRYTTRIFLFVFLISLILSGCKQSTDNQENLVAMVEDKKITVGEFRLFYELDPNFGIDSGGVGALKDELNKYIDRYLAKTKADNDRLWQDPVYQKALTWESNQAILRQLYRQVVESPVTISEDEIREEFIKQNTRVNIRHLFSKSKEQITGWYQALQQGENFEKLATVAFSDTFLANNGGNLGWLSLNDFEDNLSREIALLKPDQISRPVRSKWGYHIVQLLDREDQVIVTENDLNQQRVSIERRLRQRKQKELSNRFIDGYIGGLNPQPVTRTFKELLFALVPPSEREKKVYSQKIAVTDYEIKRIEGILAASLNKPLITYRGGTINLGEYVEALKGMPQGNRPRFENARQLSNQIGIWVRDKLLLKKAEQYNLNDNEQVLREINDFKAEQSYYYFLNMELNNLEVPDETDRYFESENRLEYSDLHRKLSQFHGIQEWKWWQAGKRLQQKLREINPQIWIDEQKLERENRAIDWRGRIRMFMIRNPS